MKNVFILVTSIFIIASCENSEPKGDIPECIEDKIESIKKQSVWNPPAKIYSYQYSGETVYYIPARCCDIMSELYDDSCNFICAPDGGVAGNGDGNCPDFFTNRTNEKLLWEDDRN